MLFTQEQRDLLERVAGSVFVSNCELFGIEYKYAKEVVENVEQTRYNVSIISFRRCHGCDQRLEREWNDLRLRQITDRWWFFRRHAAKMQINEPFRLYTFLVTRNVSKENKEAYLVKREKDKITAAKAKITQIENKIKAAKDAWRSIFPIEEDEAYKKAMSTLFTKKVALAEMEREFSERYETGKIQLPSPVH